MKKYSILIFGLAAALSFTACNKDDDGDDGNNNNSSACATGSNFCMKYGASQKNGNAELNEINATRFRVYWENATSNGFEQVEMDILGDATGSYSVDTTYANGTAAFEYFSNDGTNVIVQSGVSGTIDVTTFDPDGTGLSGTFTVTTEDGTNVTSGNFINVKKP